LQPNENTKLLPSYIVIVFAPDSKPRVHAVSILFNFMIGFAYMFMLWLILPHSYCRRLSEHMAKYGINVPTTGHHLLTLATSNQSFVKIEN